MRGKKLRVLILTAIMTWCGTAVAQDGFIHLQSENGRPFYVQWNGYTFNSSGSGYMVIPKIPAGSQTIVIGFGTRQFSEYIFKYELGEKPRAFSLKLNIDNSWSLFDMVSFDLIKGKTATAVDKQQIAQDIELMQKSGRTNESNVYRTVAAKDSTRIYKIFDKTSDEGTDVVYVVNNNGVSDTVVIFIPALPVTPQKPAETGMRNGWLRKWAGSLPGTGLRATAMLNRRRPLLIN